MGLVLFFDLHEKLFAQPICIILRWLGGRQELTVRSNLLLLCRGGARKASKPWGKGGDRPWGSAVEAVAPCCGLAAFWCWEAGGHRVRGMWMSAADWWICRRTPRTPMSVHWLAWRLWLGQFRCCQTVSLQRSCSWWYFALPWRCCFPLWSELALLCVLKRTVQDDMMCIFVHILYDDDMLDME